MNCITKPVRLAHQVIGCAVIRSSTSRTPGSKLKPTSASRIHRKADSRSASTCVEPIAIACSSAAITVARCSVSIKAPFPGRSCPGGNFLVTTSGVQLPPIGQHSTDCFFEGATSSVSTQLLPKGLPAFLCQGEPPKTGGWIGLFRLVERLHCLLHIKRTGGRGVLSATKSFHGIPKNGCGLCSAGGT